MKAKPLPIVLADDDDGQATLVQLHLERSGLINHFTRLTDGQEVLEYLSSKGRFAGQVVAVPPNGAPRGEGH